MIIDFKDINDTVIKNFKGGEKEVSARMHVDEKNRIMYGRLIPGASIGLHTHDTSSEIIYVLQGTAKVLYDGKYEEVKKGMCHYCPKGHSHSFINDGNEDVIIFAVVPEQ